MKNKKYGYIKKRITMVIAVVMAMTLTAKGLPLPVPNLELTSAMPFVFPALQPPPIFT